MKTKLFTTMLALAVTAMPVMAQVDESTPQGQRRMSCTSIMVGKRAGRHRKTAR